MLLHIIPIQHFHNEQCFLFLPLYLYLIYFMYICSDAKGNDVPVVEMKLRESLDSCLVTSVNSVRKTVRLQLAAYNKYEHFYFILHGQMLNFPAQTSCHGAAHKDSTIFSLENISSLDTDNNSGPIELFKVSQAHSYQFRKFVLV